MLMTRSHHKGRGVYPAYAEPSPRSSLGTQKTYFTATLLDEPCSLCGQIMRHHEKCRACRALVGNGHAELRTYDGVCESCISRQRDVNRRGAAEVAAAIGRNSGWE